MMERDIRFYFSFFSSIRSVSVCACVRVCVCKVLCVSALFSTVNNEAKTNKRLENCSVNGNAELSAHSNK